MIILYDILDKLNLMITGGSKYLWCGFGNNARFLDFGENSNLIFDVKTKEIYQLNFYYFPENFKEEYIKYVWTNPKYYKKYKIEVKKHPIDENCTEKEISLNYIVDLINSDLKNEKKII